MTGIEFNCYLKYENSCKTCYTAVVITWMMRQNSSIRNNFFTCLLTLMTKYLAHHLYKFEHAGVINIVEHAIGVFFEV